MKGAKQIVMVGGVGQPPWAALAVFYGIGRMSLMFQRPNDMHAGISSQANLS